MYSEQKQRNFETSLKKGHVGEQIIRDHLESRGWIVYLPFTKNKAHYFDILATLNKKKVIAIDVKTKARLNNWAAQGINIKHYYEYMEFVKNHAVPFYLCFVDDKIGDVHICNIEELRNPIYPNKEIIAWSLSQMKFLMKITEEDIKNLSQYDQRNYEFKPL